MDQRRRQRGAWLWSAVAVLMLVLAGVSHLPLRGVVWPRAERVIPAGQGTNYERIEHWLVAGRGRVGVVSQQLTGLTPFSTPAAARNSRAVVEMTFTQRFGVRPWPRVEQVAGIGPSVLLPGWMFACVGGIAVWKTWRIARRPANVRQPCASCGYERWGLSRTAACPECGEPPPAEPP